MEMLKLGPYLRNRCSDSENKLNFAPCGTWGRKEIYVQLLKLWQMAKLVLKQSVRVHMGLFLECPSHTDDQMQAETKLLLPPWQILSM